MAEVTVTQFAEVLKVPVDRLLTQLDEAGIRVAGADDIIVNSDPTFEPVRFDVDFNGPAITFGPVWHWGGQGAGKP